MAGSVGQAIKRRTAVGSSAERPAYRPGARFPPEDLRELLRQRYHVPGYPKSFGGSRHLDGRTAADAPRQNGFGSAEQPAPLPKAVSPVPVFSPQLNTGFRESQICNLKSEVRKLDSARRNLESEI